jgi:phosphoribosylformimino-5-aminoimidazole carboxamide ribotide isomerase
MKLIPVIDLMAGQVVHARRGERQNYQPIRSALCPSAAPEAILQAMVKRFACDTVYIADLDAIRFRRPQIKVIEQLRTRFPAIAIWLDAGIGDYPSYRSLTQQELATVVVGSESLTATAWLTDLRNEAWILSLDFKQGEFLGPPRMLSDALSWPQRVLAMNLAHVGSDLGPDFGLLETLQRRRPDVSIYAAGGVRDSHDLVELKRRGIAGALVATALHSGRITSADQ